MPGGRATRRNKDLSRAQSQASVSLSYHRAEGFMSPLPSANELRQLNEVVPDGAERAFRILEKQSDHRMEIEKKAINGDTGRANLGLGAGFCVAMAFLLASYSLIMNKHEVAGSVMGTIDLVSLVSAFIYGSVTRRNERIEKNRQRIDAAERRQR